MTINKFAAWGNLPSPPAPPPSPLVQAIVDARTPLNTLVANTGPLFALKGSFDTLAGTLGQVLGVKPPTPAPGPAGGPTPPPAGPTPGVPLSGAAFKVIWSLGGARDVLYDMSPPSVTELNKRLGDALYRQHQQQFLAWLDVAHKDLAVGYKQVFAALDDTLDFETQRRQRLADLLVFEQRVGAEVQEADLPPLPSIMTSRTKA